MTVAFLLSLSLSLGLASAQAPATDLPTEKAAEAPPVESAMTATTLRKNGTRPIPKTGVKEAKEACKREGHKGRALSTCIQSRTAVE